MIIIVERDNYFYNNRKTIDVIPEGQIHVDFKSISCKCLRYRQEEDMVS